MKRMILTAGRCFFVVAILGATLFGVPHSVQAAGLAVTTVSVTSVTQHSATFNGTLNSPGDAIKVTFSFEYSFLQNMVITTFPFSGVAPSPGITTNFSTLINNLQANTVYIVRAKVDGGTAGVAYGADISFTTLADLPVPPATAKMPVIKPPVIETVAVTSLGTTSATLNAHLISLGDRPSASVSFEYGPTDKYANTVIADSVLNPGDLSFTISELIPWTLYHFRAVASGGTDAVSYGQDATFVTASITDTAPASPTVIVTTTVPTNTSSTVSTTTARAAPTNGTNNFYTGLLVASGAIIAMIALLILVIKTRNNDKP
jgi:hypothetical protein